MSGKRQSTVLVSRKKQSSAELAPLGGESVPVGGVVPSADTLFEEQVPDETPDEIEEEQLEAETPKLRANPRNPTSNEKREHEDSGHADVAFEDGFTTQEGADTLPILTCRDCRDGQTAAASCERSTDG